MHINIAAVKIISIVVMAAIFLCACEEEEIIYEIPSRNLITQAMCETDTASEGDSRNVADALGIKDKKWKEELKTNNGSVKIKASMMVPDVTDMYIMKVREHYADNADKKRIVEQLFDARQVKVNLNKVPSVQWADNAYRLMDEIVAQYPDYREVKEYCEMERKIINKGYSDLPSRDSLSEDVGDYSANHYIGTKDGIVYTLDFFTDPDTNRSLWTYRAKNQSDFHENAINIMSAFNDRYTVGMNDSALSEQEAMQIAEKKAADLGFDYMRCAISTTLQFVVGGSGQDNYKTEYDGYYFVMVRGCEDNITDGMIHYMNPKDNQEGALLYDPDSMTKPYDRERMCMEINEKGILSITCSGWMDVVESPQIAKLMPFSEVQESIRSVLKETVKQNNMTFEHLYLTYVKVMDEEDEDVYRYIPAWRLNRHDWDMVRDGISQNYWVSAIDGTQILTQQCGDADIINADDFLMELDFTE